MIIFLLLSVHITLFKTVISLTLHVYLPTIILLESFKLAAWLKSKETKRASSEIMNFLPRNFRVKRDVPYNSRDRTKFQNYLCRLEGE